MRWGVCLGLCAALLVAVSSAAGASAPVNRIEDRDPVFSPAGKAIAFVRWSSRNGTGRVMLMHRDGHGLRPLTPMQQRPYGLTWSPDGASLAYTSGGDIWRVDLAGGTPVNLTVDASHQSFQPAWSPDGRWIAYARFQDCWRCTAVHLVSADGAQSRVVVARGTLARRPVWSPDGASLALSDTPAAVVALDGTTRVRLPQTAFYTTFSPSGTKLAYVSGGLFVHDIPGGTGTRLGTQIRQFPEWSRDGRFLAGTGFRAQLAIVRADGRTVATIRTAGMTNDAPSWGADDRVAFVHAAGCGIDIARRSGAHVHRLTRVC